MVEISQLPSAYVSSVNAHTSDRLGNKKTKRRMSLLYLRCFESIPQQEISDIIVCVGVPSVCCVSLMNNETALTC